MGYLSFKTFIDEGGYDRGYPFYEWNLQDDEYVLYKYLYQGDWLKETVSDNSEELKYPLKINPFKLPVSLHTSFLYGEVPDSTESLVTPSVEIWGNGSKNDTKEAKRQAEKMESFLGQILYENHARSLLSDLANDAQVFGGCVAGAYYDPERELENEYPITIQRIEPDTFYPVWSAKSPDRLVDVHVSYMITGIQAQSLGVDTDADFGIYVEHWTKDNYSISVDETEIAGGLPRAGIIPYIYIPHPPRVGFYGTSLLKNMDGLAKEINSQAANVGDIISEEAANIPAIRNTRNVQIKRVSGRKPIIDLGFQQGDRIPDMLWPPSKATSAQNSSQHVRNLMDQIRTDMYCPKVLFGGGDTSQRSTSSFAFLAIPLVAHIRKERAFFTSGYSKLCKYVLMLAANLGIGGFSPEYVRKARIKMNWYPMLPRDVIEETTSVITRYQAGLLSSETAIKQIGDVLDIQSELDRIRSESKPDKSNPFRGTGASGEFGGIKSKEGVMNNA